MTFRGSELDKILKEVPPLYLAATTSESTYYASLRPLLGRLLSERRLPLDVRVSTTEPRGGGGRDQPDLALYHRGDYAAVLIEVKLSQEDLRDLAFSVERNDQVGRYLAQTGVVLITNVRSFGLVACRSFLPLRARDCVALRRSARAWPGAR